MEQTWTNDIGETLVARIPANVLPYVEIMGVDLAAEFFLRYGGASLYVASRSGGSGHRSLADLIGEEKVDALFRAFGNRIERVPVAPRFIARHYRSRDKSVLEIARLLHRADKTIRGYLSAGGGSPVARIRSRKAG